ncbi:MAG: dehydrogenase E1 component subunit alpha/beta [Acidobacteriia bacterium]|nr:dehydrogenase E1 component subunit alpha/beta [Terriglobia bacterium]
MKTKSGGAPPLDVVALRHFIALECPFLLSAVREIADSGITTPEARIHLLAALDHQLCDSLESADDVLFPGISLSDGVAWTRAPLAELIDGFFRRQEIKASLTAGERIEMYSKMILTRELDDLLKKLFQEKQIAWHGFPSAQKGFRARGQEAAVGLALRLRRGSEQGDIASPLIRGLPVVLMYMDDPAHVVLVQCGKKDTPVGGRDLHVGDLAHGILPPAAPMAVATQTLIGFAYAARLRREDRVFLSIMGDGGTSQGEWHEAVNFAAVQKLNVIFVVEDNLWALGTHRSEQTAAKRFALKAGGYGIPGITVFGNDPDEIAAASAWAAERARQGKGPTLIELLTYRRSGHAHHDDDRYHGAPGVKGYEFEEERRLWEAADPILLYEERLRSEKLLDATAIAEIRAEAARRVREARTAAEAAPWPESRETLGSCYALRGQPARGLPSKDKRLMSYDEAVRQAILEEMESDARVFVLGEDIGGRYGGAFGVTRGLVRQFGPERCLNTPLSESAIVGCGVGAALAGMRPVVEMQFADFLAPAFNALVNNAAKIHWRFGRAVPLVVRLPYGGATGTCARLLGGGPFHSQCPEAWFLRTPGWKIVAPATPRDAKGLMTAALRDNNPVLYLEAKGLYGFFRPDLREEVPLGDYEVPIGKAALRRSGRDVSLVTYGAMVYTALTAAAQLAREGIDVEVIDLRSLCPLDEGMILGSIARTHRALLLHEDTRRAGVGAELAAIIGERALWELAAPVLRVCAPDTPAPYSPPLEYAYLPKPDDVVAAARTLMRES